MAEMICKCGRQCALMCRECDSGAPKLRAKLAAAERERDELRASLQQTSERAAVLSHDRDVLLARVEELLVERDGGLP